MKVTPRAFINHLQEGMLGRRRLLQVTFSCPAELEVPSSPALNHAPAGITPGRQNTAGPRWVPGDWSTAGLRLCRQLRGQRQDALSVVPGFRKAAHPEAIAGSSAEASFKPESTLVSEEARSEVEGRHSSPESLHI